MAINAEAELPSYLTMVALSVERVYRELDMRSTAAIDLNVQIVGRGRDLTHWFRMLRFADPEIWKGCPAHSSEASVIIDIWEQMGRVASHHFEQLTSFLIEAAAIRCAADSALLAMLSQTKMSTMATWIRTRLQLESPEQFLILRFPIFQDELLETCAQEVAQKFEAVIESEFIFGDRAGSKPAVRQKFQIRWSGV